MTRMTHSKRIVDLLRKYPGLDDDEISRLTRIEPRQQVNRICRLLESKGQLKRVLGPAEKIVNYLMGDDRLKTVTDFSPLASINRRRPTSRSVARPPRSTPRSGGISSAAVETSQLSETLLILPCSGKKSSCHEVRETGPRITRHLSDDLAGRLSDARARVRTRAAIDETTMVPAWRRYDGYLYDAARESLCKAVDKNLHVLILSGGYGILLVNEPIGNYRARLNLAWWPDGLLEETIVAYAKRHRLKRMRALVAATTSYSRLVRQVDWRATGVDDAVLLKPESIGGGAMVKVPRAQGEAFAALLDGELEYGWQSSDGIELRIERLG